MLGERRSRLAVTMLLLMILLMIPSAIPITASSSSQTLYAHAETTTIGGQSYYLHKVSSADGPATTLSQSAASTGRKLMGRWVYPLSGIVSIPASTWTVTYRAMRSASASSVKAHGDIDILIRKSDNTIRTTIATNVANSPNITLVNAWQTLTGTCNWAAYTVVDQADYLEVAYYIQVTTSQSSKYVRLLVDNGTLPLADQTKIQNVMFTYPNQAPVASFTFSPSNPAIYETVTFNASASNDPDGNIVSYKWDFGDGNITTVANPIITHVYTTAGSTVNYTVTLTVTDNEGSTGSTTQNVPVTNPSILHVSLPAGIYAGPDTDNWLSQCWLLSINGLSGTFTIRINNTHASWTSYDTHLIIALNNASYDYLGSLAVDATTIPKTSFIYGTPEPYGFTLTWEEDVYPTWFSDIYVVGTVDPKSYKDVQVYVTFSNTNGVRMHFDAYGSRCSPPPPTGKGLVTHNPHEKDSTVLFYPPPTVPPHADFTWEPPSPQVCETVTFNASASYDPDGYIVNYTWNFGDGNITWVADRIITHHYATNGTYTVNLTVTDNDGLTNSTVKIITVRKHPVANFTWSPFSPQVGEQVTFNGSLSTPDGGTIVSYEWDFGDGTLHEFGEIVTHNYTTAGTYTVILNVTDSEGKWDTEWGAITVKAKRYYLTVKTDPADIVTIPGEDWYANCTSVDLTAPTSVSVSPGVQYRFDYWDVDGTNVTGNPITVHMDANHTATAHYVKQYYLTVISPYGTTGGQGWYDNCTTAYATLNTSVVDHGNGTRRVFANWSGDASGTNYSKSEAIHMDQPKTAIANWKTQFLVTFDQTGLDGTATGTVVTINGVGKTYNQLPNSTWFDNGSQVTYSYYNVSSSVSGKRFNLTGVTGPTSPITVTSPVTVTGNYKTQYQITVTASPSGAIGGTFKVTYTQCGTTYTNVQKTTPWTEWADASTNVDLTAQAVSGYTFRNWDVDGTNVTGNPITVHMNQTHTATAYYAAAVQPRKCVVDFTETPTSPIRNGTKVTFTVQVLQKAFNGTHEIDCTLYEWNLTDPNGASHILRFGKQWSNFSDTMQWTFNIVGDWKVTLRAWCNDAKLISLGMAWSDPVSQTKKVTPVVGGYIVPVDKLSLVAPLIILISSFIAATIATTTPCKYKSRKH